MSVNFPFLRPLLARLDWMTLSRTNLCFLIALATPKASSDLSSQLVDQDDTTKLKLPRDSGATDPDLWPGGLRDCRRQRDCCLTSEISCYTIRKRNIFTLQFLSSGNSLDNSIVQTPDDEDDSDPALKMKPVNLAHKYDYFSDDD